mmetsp:Transcript_48003/g.108784  ORF Transcript_48003/g.108784 Transcript_48003/m.108784 type:complete len:201 (-) Transcript_48003:162-764(-)
MARLSSCSSVSRGFLCSRAYLARVCLQRFSSGNLTVDNLVFFCVAACSPDLWASSFPPRTRHGRNPRATAAAPCASNKRLTGSGGCAWLKSSGARPNVFGVSFATATGFSLNSGGACLGHHPQFDASTARKWCASGSTPWSSARRCIRGRRKRPCASSCGALDVCEGEDRDNLALEPGLESSASLRLLLECKLMGISRLG